MDMTTTYGHGTGPRAQQALRDQQERERLANDLARWAGAAAEATHDEAYKPDRRHGIHCCMHARLDGERNEHAFAMEMPLDKLRRRHASTDADRRVVERLAGLAEVEPPPGWVDRAVERARREGVL